jgi:transcription antitermination factor NusG
LDGNSYLAWYALSVRSLSEQNVSKALNLKGIECFLPSISALRRWSDRVKAVETPLFPGYLFAKFDCRSSLPVLTTPAVLDILGFGDRYEPVSEAELNAIRRVLEVRAKCEPTPFLKVGQAVVIESGPLAGVEGFLIEIRSSRRLVVSVSLLQRSVSVELSPELITGVRVWPQQYCRAGQAGSIRL